MIYAYIRVSTESQTTENQRHEIERFCAANGLCVDRWVAETTTGTREPGKRKLGTVIMREATGGDMVICTELSRFGRSLLMIMNTLQYFLERNIAVWTIKDGYRLSDEIQCKVIAFAFSLAAEIERRLISARTKAALERVRAQGRTLGRPAGSRPALKKLAARTDFIYQSLAAGTPRRTLAAQLGVSVTTLSRFLKAQNDSSGNTEKHAAGAER